MGDIARLRQLYSERQLGEAWRLYLENPPSRNAEWHLYGGLTAWARRDYPAGRLAVERGLGMRPTAEIRAKLHFAGGIINREGECLGQALEHLDACLVELGRCPKLHPVLLGPAYYNKALALTSYDRAPEGLQYYERAAVEFRKENLVDYLRQCLQNLAWAALESGDLDRAEPALDEAEPLCRSEEALWRQRLTRAFADCVAGRYRDALRLCEWIEREARVDERCLAMTIVAEVALRQELWEPAEQAAIAAVQLATQTEECRCTLQAARVLHRVRARMAEERGA